jgi:hypothetical protein
MTMRFFAEIQRVDEEQRMVWGYASTENRASDGKIITRAAMEGALDDYMEFANVREMHQPSAVGRTDEAHVDDGGLYVGVKVVDDAAWKKVVERVYKGFSIGAKATAYDPDDKTVVTGMLLSEISLVDRPADTGAKFDLFRAEGIDVEDDDEVEVERRDFTDAQRKAMADKGDAMPDGGFPIATRADLENAVRAYGRAKNKRAVRRHIMKRARALGAADLIPEDWTQMARAENGESEDQVTRGEAEQAQGAVGAGEGTADAGGSTAEDDAAVDDEGGEQVDAGAENEADPVARAVQAAEEAGQRAATAVELVQRAVGDAEAQALPGAEIRRGFYSVGRVASLLAELCYLTSESQWEADIEADNSPVPGKLRAAVLELAKAYKAMSDEELAELLNGTGVDVQLENGIIALMAADADLERSEAAGEISEAQAGRLKDLFDAFIARGWKPTDAAAPEDADELRRQVDSLTADRETLLRSVDGLTEKVTGLADQVTRLAEVAAPARTAGLRAVAKEEDVSGGGGSAPVQRAASEEEIQRYLDALPGEERALLLTRAALARPIAINNRQIAPAGG